MPHLAAVRDPDRVRRRLGSLLARGAKLESVDVAPLGYKPTRRFVVGYRVHSVDGAATEWIGKSLRRGADERCWSVYEIWKRARSRRDSWPGRVALPHGRIPEWNMLVWPRIGGIRFLDHLVGRDAAASLAAKVGSALADLQCSDVPWSTRHLAADEIAVVERWCDALRTGRPDVLFSAMRAVRELRRWSASTDSSRLVPCHRDFYDKQVLIDRDRITLLDLDTACLAEPELDVANFSAHLTLRRIQQAELSVEDARQAFLDAHARIAGPLDVERLAFYEACSLARLACVYALRGSGYELVGELAEAALAVLAPRASLGRSVHAI